MSVANTARRDLRFELEPPSPMARTMLFVLAVALPIAITVIALAWASTSDASQSLIAGDPALTNAVVMIGLVVLVVPIWWFIDRAIRRHRLDITGDGVEIRTTFYRRTLALPELDLDAARVVDLRERSELKPFVKTNATAMPGFRSGWFRLRNRRKAFVAMAAGPRVLWIPTRGGFDLLLQSRQAQTLLDHLRAMAGTRQRR